MRELKPKPVRTEGSSRFFLIAYDNGGTGIWGTLEDWEKCNTEDLKSRAVAIFSVDHCGEPEELDILPVEGLQKVGDKIINLRQAIHRQERILELSGEWFNDARKPINHLWPESERPPGVRMICDKLFEFKEHLEQLAAAAARIVEDDSKPTLEHMRELDRQRARASALLNLGK